MFVGCKLAMDLLSLLTVLHSEILASPGDVLMLCNEIEGVKRNALLSGDCQFLVTAGYLLGLFPGDFPLFLSCKIKLSLTLCSSCWCAAEHFC